MNENKSGMSEEQREQLELKRIKNGLLEPLVNALIQAVHAVREDNIEIAKTNILLYVEGLLIVQEAKAAELVKAERNKLRQIEVIANNLIYFDDGHDYGSGLREILEILKPGIDQDNLEFIEK